MDLKDLRNEIDQIDDQLVALFVRRMEISAQVAAYKKEHQLPVFVPQRETEKLADIAEKAGTNMSEYACSLYRSIFELSRDYQTKLLEEVL